MTRWAYVDGAYAPLRAATVSILDRGFQFADSVYEVWAVREGRFFNADAHMERLNCSLAAVRLAKPMSDAALWTVLRETIRRNHVANGIVYLQISRGVAPRDHFFPAASVRPTLIVTATSLSARAQQERAARGVSVVTTRETRWARRDIKSVNLLPNVLARQAAREAGGYEAWFVDEAGFVTEGTSSTAWIVDPDGVIRTRPLSNDLLHGVTRATLLRIAAERQMTLAETPFTVAQALMAREAFMSSASNPAMPIVMIDGVTIADGRPGPIATALRAAYLGAAARDG